MGSSNAFKVLLAAVLVAGVAWKIVVATERPIDWRNGLVEFLERNHFNVVVTEQLGTDVPIIQANTSSCRLQIAKLAPDGSDQGFIRDLFMSKIAYSSSFVAVCTLNSLFFGLRLTIFGLSVFVNLD